MNTRKALIISLFLNVLIIGILVGMFVHSKKFRPPPPFMGIPKDIHERFESEIKSFMEKNEPIHKQMKVLMEETLHLLEQEPLNDELIRANMKKGVETREHFHAQLDNKILEIAHKISPEERIRCVESILTSLKKRPFGKKRGFPPPPPRD